MMEENFINKLTEMGYDYTDVKDFIEDRGIPENDPTIVVAGLREPQRYRNALFRGGQQQQEMGYQYFNPGDQRNQKGMPSNGRNQQQLHMPMGAMNNQYISAP